MENNFLKYLKKPISIHEIEMVYIKHGIILEHATLYRNFILTLNNLIIRTYLGDDVTNQLEQINHFDWCWKQTCGITEHTQLNLLKNKKIYNYFLKFYFQTYYLIPNKDVKKNKINNLGKVWNQIFSYNPPKTRSDLDSFIVIYKMFERSIKLPAQPKR